MLRIWLEAGKVSNRKSLMVFSILHAGFTSGNLLLSVYFRGNN